MRVPDLDWPADLFTDVIEVPPSTIVVEPARPNLWTEMVNAWMGDDTHAESQWPVAVFNSAQIAW